MPDTQEILLIAAVAVAGLVCFRLYSVLGRRTGNEMPRVSPTARLEPRGAALTPPVEPVSGGNGLIEIQLADRDFDTQRFLEGAREAYARIARAFAAGDREALKPLLSPDVLAAFDGAIAARGPGRPPQFESLGNVRIANASLVNRHAEITLAFTARYSGDAGAHDVTDVWTFARDLGAADPNWVLVATSGDLPE